MSSFAPRIGVPFFEPSGLPDAVYDAGAEPVPLRLLDARPAGGVALAREWAADLTTISCADESLDGLLLASENPEDILGMCLATLHLDLPAVCVPPTNISLHATLAALGLSPLNGQLSDTIAALAGGKVPRIGALVDNFSLANAARAVAVADGGLELAVHLAALAREAGVVDFSRMFEVLSSETPAVSSGWSKEHGCEGLLAYLGEALHDVPTVMGGLREGLPDAPPVAGEHSRLVFAGGRSSGTGVVCRVGVGVAEVAGECRVFEAEKIAVRAVESGEVEEGTLLVVRGCGPRGGPGLLRLDGLAGAMREAGVSVPVLTDGLAPEEAPGVWGSLFAPEAAVGGVIGRLRDGDVLRLDLMEGRIKTAVEAEEFAERTPYGYDPPSGAGYANRLARSALPGLEGGGFG